MDYRSNKINFIKEIRRILQEKGEPGSLVACKAIADWIINEGIVKVVISDTVPDQDNIVILDGTITIHNNYK